MPDPRAVQPHFMDRTTILVYRLTALLEQASSRLFREVKVDHYGSRMLVLLLERGGLRIGDLVEAMLLPQSTISEQVKRLEKRGYLTRQRTATDARSVVVNLTPKGEETARACDAVSLRFMGVLHRGIDPDVVTFVGSQLRRMFANLEAFAAAPAETVSEPAVEAPSRPRPREGRRRAPRRTTPES